MIIRCYTCNTPLAHLRERYEALVASGTSPQDALDNMNLKRMCCRVKMIAFVPMHEDLKRFSADDCILDDAGTTLMRHSNAPRRVCCSTGQITTLDPVDLHKW